jgi:hypothetical protein
LREGGRERGGRGEKENGRKRERKSVSGKDGEEEIERDNILVRDAEKKR